MALVPCLTKHVLRENQDYVPGEREYPPSPFVGSSFVQSWVAGKALQTEGGPVSLSQRSPSQVLLLLGELAGLGFPRGGSTMWGAPNSYILAQGPQC